MALPQQSSTPFSVREIVINGLEFRIARLPVPADSGDEARWWIIDPAGRDHIGPVASMPLSDARLPQLITEWWTGVRQLRPLATRLHGMKEARGR